jgi:hypothetical protein
MSFFKPYRIPIKEKSSQRRLTAPLSYIHQPYCWQVALQHGLLPLRVDSRKIKALLKINIPQQVK